MLIMIFLLLETLVKKSWAQKVYPPMTSFSDPKGIIQTVTVFHIKAEFLC